MDEVARVVRLPEHANGETVYESPDSAGVLLGVDAPAPPGVDVAVVLGDGRRLGYAPRAAGPDAGAEVAPDVLLRGNALVQAHASSRSLAAHVSIAGGRRLNMGPESERVLVVLRGHGLVFLQNEDTLRIEPGDAAVLPAGEPARVWAQEEDLLAVVLQPVAGPAARRTLAGEIARRRQQAPEEDAGFPA